jgi:hypothetical protein
MLTLRFEASRLLAGVSKCIMYNPFPDLTVEYEMRARAVVTHETGKIENVYASIEELEEELREKVTGFEFSNLEIQVEPFFFLVNRIVSTGRILISPELQFYLCIDRVSRTLRKIRKAELRVIKSRKPEKICRVNELEGELLGYPDCCISNFSKRKRLRNLGKNVKSPEGEIAEEFVNTGYHLLVDRVFSNRALLKDAELPNSLFTFNFYPCSIKCKKAEKTGERCKNALAEIGEETLFKAGVLSVMCDILKLCIKMKRINGKNRDYCYTNPEEIIRMFI